jgi:hypothetical protein
MRFRFVGARVLWLAVLALAGCSSYAESALGGGGGGGGTGDTGDGAPMGGLDRSGSSESGGDSGSAGTSTGTGGDGELTAGVWDDNAEYERFVEFVGASGVQLPFTDQDRDAAHQRFTGDRDGHTRLDVALVIDTTGSMGDEITYLQTELSSIATRVDSAYPDAEIRWALIVYRDETDDYVTRVFDFGSLPSLRANLAAQGADGGGDWPEASHAALRDLTNLSFREDPSVARLAFWVADAPHHDEHAEEWADALRTAAELDVHVYPIASSGVDTGTEVGMRSAAQLTGGRYLFLTDDSGIGAPHAEPSIPCYVVTHLDDAMLRMIDIEMRGEHVAATPEQVIRSVGEPVEGVCTLEDGSTVRAF